MTCPKCLAMGRNVSQISRTPATGHRGTSTNRWEQLTPQCSQRLFKFEIVDGFAEIVEYRASTTSGQRLPQCVLSRKSADLRGNRTR